MNLKQLTAVAKALYETEGFQANHKWATADSDVRMKWIGLAGAAIEAYESCAS